MENNSLILLKTKDFGKPVFILYSQIKMELSGSGTAGGVSKYLGTSFFIMPGQMAFRIMAVYSIIEDHNNNLWFGTWGSGIIKFDGKSFSHFTRKGRFTK